MPRKSRMYLPEVLCHTIQCRKIDQKNKFVPFPVHFSQITACIAEHIGALR